IAEKSPEKAFLGVEVHAAGVGKLLSEIERRGLTNVRIVQADVVDVLSSMIPNESLSGVHIFFPDPWPKKRHHKRRLFTEAFAHELYRKLKHGGYIYLVTDIDDYAQEMLRVGAATEGLINPKGGFSERLAFRPDTAFEKKAHADGRPVREILFKKL
ncbi:MAG TPA: tRNA (guanosine(46)-N7)-methyltransferase TrmB, partial [Spirochaetia bacterium]|nr:tRNA (guanosine(46)-N7)-methyltransferase TrmB [Spirochaetia bacterium]